MVGIDYADENEEDGGEGDDVDVDEKDLGDDCLTGCSEDENWGDSDDDEKEDEDDETTMTMMRGLVLHR